MASKPATAVYVRRKCDAIKSSAVALLEEYNHDGIVTFMGSGRNELTGPPLWHEAVTDPRRGHRFPAEIIAHAVWLYHVFSLSLRDVELLLAERGVVVSYESVRRWCLKFGRSFADKLRRRRPRPGDIWHCDEVCRRINGEPHYLWRAVDQHGVVLDILVQERRNASAATRFFKRLLQGSQFKPRRLITDDFRSYGVAKPDPTSEKPLPQQSG